MPKPARVDAAILALLSPTEPDGLNDAYLESLVDEFERRRAAYARDVVGYMADDYGPLSASQIAACRAKHLEQLLAFRPDDMKAVLVCMMEDDDDLGRAAALFLHGHEKGIWQATEDQINYARELANLSPSPDLEDIEARFAELFDEWRARRQERETPQNLAARLKRLRPVMVAAHEMRSVVADPNASPDRKLGTVRRWLDALEAAGEHATVLEFCIMSRIALLKAEARSNTQRA